MATIKISGLSNIQANVLAIAFENKETLEYFNHLMIKHGQDELNTPAVIYDDSKFAPVHEIEFDS